MSILASLLRTLISKSASSAKAAPEVKATDPLSSYPALVKAESEIFSSPAWLLRSVERIARAKRKEKLIVFFGRDSFSDNTKYLFLYALEHLKEYECVWCTRSAELEKRLLDAGLPVFNIEKNAPGKVITFLMRAQCAVFCSNFLDALGAATYLEALRGAELVQLWHGISIKRLDLMLMQGKDDFPVNFQQQWLGVIDAGSVLSPSSREDGFWAQAFGKTPLIRAGYPRNEVLLREATGYELIDAAKLADAAMQARPLVLFAPTHALSGNRAVDLNRVIPLLLRFTRSMGGHLVIKPHPFQEICINDVGDITKLPADADIYPILNRMDILVTDHSSIFIDYLLLDRPVVLLKTMSKLEEDVFLYEPERYRCAAYAANEDNLYEVLQKAYESDSMQLIRQEVASLAFETDPATACSDIARQLCLCQKI